MSNNSDYQPDYKVSEEAEKLKKGREKALLHYVWHIAKHSVKHFSQ